MSKRGYGYGSGNRANILEKVKVGPNWNLYPAVLEPNGKLHEEVDPGRETRGCALEEGVTVLRL